MLGRSLRVALLLAISAGLVIPASSQQTSKITLDNSPTVFGVLAALNTCGYDQELGTSDPLRAAVRRDIRQAVQSSQAAAGATQEICNFYRDHQQADAAQDVSQYISLALSLGEPPDFKPKVKAADMPPDTAYVLGFIPLLSRFYEAAGLAKIWELHRADYDALIERHSEAVSKTILATDVYLKMPISGYLGRQFKIYLDPLVAPGQINARNYGADYYIVLAPDSGGLPLAQIRHTYLHFVLDPLALKRANAMKRLQPLLREVQTAPMAEAYKSDVTLLLTESLVRAIEAHLTGGKKDEAERQRLVDQAMSEGYILSRYFYEQLTKFANDPASLRDVYPDWLYFMDLNRERKRAAATQFAPRAAPELVGRSNAATASPLDLAEQKLGEGDVAAAQELAQEAAQQKGPDEARAYFILGQAATLNKDAENAIAYFQRVLQLGKEPRLIAWSHIYLARIYDVQQEREEAVKHYRAALQSGDTAPATRAAAERGLKQGYERKEAKPEN